MVEVVPSHGVNIGLPNFFGKLSLMPRQESIQVSILKKPILLYDLRIYAG
jgi:hypothetical protein